MDISQLKIQINNLQTLFWICCAAAVIFGILTIILFIRFQIPELIGELTGISAQKAIRRYSEASQKALRNTGFKVFETAEDKIFDNSIESDEETLILEKSKDEETIVLDNIEDEEMCTLVLNENLE